MPLKHIYWFAYFNTDEPSVRYRGKYPLQRLKEEYNIGYNLVTPGYTLKLIYLFIKTYCSILFLRKPDSVIVYEKIHTQRIYGTALKLLLRLQPKHTIYDIDDADYLKFPPENILYFMKHVSLCITGSAALESFVARQNKNTLILTSPVLSHEHIKNKRNKTFTIGWVGYYNAHRESLLQLFFPALLQVTFPVKLVLMGVVKPEHFEEIIRFFDGNNNVLLEMPRVIDWHNENDIYARIATFDVGVAPLIDTEINRSKSAFKVKQYLSCGIPVLGSSLGENSVFLKNSINGFVCNNSDDYTLYIQKVIEMTDADYNTLSKNALLSVSTFSMDHYCQSLLHHFGAI